MVQTLLESGGLQYAVEAERIVGLRPRAPFVPWLEKIPGARREQTDQGIAIVLASHLPPEGRFAEARPGDRDKVPSKLAVFEGASRACEWGKRRRPAQSRPGPDRPAYKIDPVRWPEVLSRIEQGESLRKVARI